MVKETQSEEFKVIKDEKSGHFGFVMDKTFFFWGRKISRLTIYQERLHNMVRLLFDGVAMFVGVARNECIPTNLY